MPWITSNKETHLITLKTRCVRPNWCQTHDYIQWNRDNWWCSNDVVNKCASCLFENKKPKVLFCQNSETPYKRPYKEPATRHHTSSHSGRTQHFAWLMISVLSWCLFPWELNPNWQQHRKLDIEKLDCLACSSPRASESAWRLLLFQNELEFRFATRLEDVLNAAFEDGFPQFSKEDNIPSKLWSIFSLDDVRIDLNL